MYSLEHIIIYHELKSADKYMDSEKPFIFYGNSSLKLGAGHLMRLLALAQWLAKAGFKPLFLYKECLDSVLSKLAQAGFRSQKITSLESIAQLKPSHIVIDDYHLSATEWRLIEALPAYKIIFDDALNAKPLPADLIINSSPQASLTDYQKRAPQALLCLGSQFSLLRMEFVEQAARLAPLSARQTVLISMGGTDVLGVNLPLCQHLLKHYPDLSLELVIASKQSPQRQALEDLAAQYAQLHLFINPPKVAEHMAKAGLALSAAGSTLNELACMQLPSIALVCADNQASLLKSTKPWCRVYDFRAFKPPAEQRIAELAAVAHALYLNLEQRLGMQKLALDAINIKGGQAIVDKIISLNNKT